MVFQKSRNIFLVRHRPILQTAEFSEAKIGHTLKFGPNFCSTTTMTMRESWRGDTILYVCGCDRLENF